MQKFIEAVDRNRTLALDALKQSLTGAEKTVILDGDSELAQILTGAN